MSMNVKCKCNKEVYNKNGYKVYGFLPTGGDPIEVNRYGTFTISGEQSFDVGQEYYLTLSSIDNPKYPCSYSFDGFVGIGFVGEEIKVDPDAQVRILSMYMEESQAKACTEAYPNFVELILTNRENEINVKKIHGVGDKLLAKYCDKIRGDCKSVLFGGILSEYGTAESHACAKASITFSSPTKLREAINDDSYGVLCNLYEKKTKAIDRMVQKKHPELLTTKSRCKSAVNDLLDEMESEGSTRCNANVIAKLVKEEYPECIKWIGECITENEELFFDPETKYVSKMATFEAELKIAKELKKRMENIEPFKIDREKYRNLGTMRLSDEQMGILDSVSQHGVSMLTGNAGCVDADTEFFTGHGWKRIADYEQGDKVLQYNENGTAELVEPVAYIKKPCDYLWHFETKYGINQTVCDEHRIVYWSKDNCFHECNIQEIIDKQNAHGWHGRFASSFKYGGTGIDLTDEQIRLMCAIICDGSFYSRSKKHNDSYNTCRFHIKKERKKERLRKLIAKANLEWHEIKSVAEGYTDFYTTAPMRAKQFDDIWYNCTNHQLQIICDEILYWDGSFNLTKNGLLRKRLSSNVLCTAEFIQFAFSSCGYRAAISVRDRTGQQYLTCGKMYTRKSIEYNVIITNRNFVGLNTDSRKKGCPTKIEKVPSTDGYKYCFTVPSHMLVLRRKNCIFITGNCGKTSATNALVKILEDNKLTYTLLAPTGCAAKRLRESTARPTSTIHMHMAMDKCVGDVLIIDEFSQVGIDLLGKLFANSRIQPETRLVFVCDPAQLASISCGNLAQDIISSGIVPVTRLTKVFRYNSSGIATVVADTREGNPASIESDQFDDYTFIPQSDDTSEVLDDIRDAYRHYLDKGYKMKDILCLCPYNKGALGTRVINSILQEEFNDHEFTSMCYESMDNIINFKIGDKVINIKNNYNANVYDPDTFGEVFYDEFGNSIKNTTFVANGDIGIVVDCFVDDVDDSILVVAFDEVMIYYTNEDIKNLQLAYAISCHKSQGSESPVVIALMLRQHMYMINRNIEYVAFSRAKTELCIIGDERTIANGMKEVQNLERDTWLKELLTENS